VLPENRFESGDLGLRFAVVPWRIVALHLARRSAARHLAACQHEVPYQPGGRKRDPCSERRRQGHIHRQHAEYGQHPGGQVQAEHDSQQRTGQRGQLDHRHRTRDGSAASGDPGLRRSGAERQHRRAVDAKRRTELVQREPDPAERQQLQQHVDVRQPRRVLACSAGIDRRYGSGGACQRPRVCRCGRPDPEPGAGVGTDYYGASKSPTTSYFSYGHIWQNNPATSAPWTPNEAINAGFGYRRV
jgi:hypothetical protein